MTADKAAVVAPRQFARRRAARTFGLGEYPTRKEPVCLSAILLASGGQLKDAIVELHDQGLETHVVKDCTEALREVVFRRAGVIVVEYRCLDRSVEDFMEAVRLVPGGVDIPVLLVGVGRSRLKMTLAAGNTDVVRRPARWPIAAVRAARMAAEHVSANKLERLEVEVQDLRLVEKETTSRVRKLETVDELTGLPNREVFSRIVEQSIPAAHRRGLKVALLYLDIDRFSEVNHTLGRRVGDRVIQEVARRLDQRLRSLGNLGVPGAGMTSATLARLGADEFAILLGGVGGREDAERVANELTSVVTDVVVVKDREIFLTASIGVALSAPGVDDRENLLQAAEAVTAEARHEGGGRIRFYSADLVEMTMRKRSMMTALRNALDRNNLFVVYQPIVDVATGRMVAAEALLRWRDPVMGVVSPGEFVPIAEETGLMLPIGSWVLNTACLQLRRWITAGLPEIRMAVNVSLCQLQRGNLDEVTRHALEATGIKPHLLELEISERGGLPDDPRVLQQLHRVRNLGVRLSVDDFGTGESAIAYLRRLPINSLKIDRSYISRFDSSDDDKVIASAMIAMAHGLNLDVVAEGVEEDVQLTMLEEWGCDEFQGFLYSKPVGPEGLARLLSLEKSIRCRDGGSDTRSEGSI